MLRWHAKVICGVIMFIDMPICFLLPVKMANLFARWGRKGQHVLDLLTCFAGGVFLASYLVFMAPAVRFLIEEYLMIPNRIEYPLPDALIGLGFFVMLIIDKVVKVISSRVKRQGNTYDEYNHSNHTSNNLNIISHLNQHSTNAHELQKLSDEKIYPSEEKDDTFGIICSPKKLTDDKSSVSEENEDAFGIVCSPNHVVCSRMSSKHEGGDHVILSRRESIVEAAGDSLQSTTRSIVMMLALSIDSVLEGMTIGLKKTVIEVWAIFIGIIIHESVIAFCLGLQLFRIHRRLYPVLIASIIYTLMNPIGVILATSIYETMQNDSIELANGILQALTAGCFIYIIFYEILEGQVNQETPLSKIIAIFIGYVFLAAFAAIPGSGSYNFGENNHDYRLKNDTA